jgi:hypothetical protein
LIQDFVPLKGFPADAGSSDNCKARMRCGRFPGADAIAAIFPALSHCAGRCQQKKVHFANRRQIEKAMLRGQAESMKLAISGLSAAGCRTWNNGRSFQPDSFRRGAGLENAGVVACHGVNRAASPRRGISLPGRTNLVQFVGSIARMGAYVRGGIRI